MVPGRPAGPSPPHPPAVPALRPLRQAAQADPLQRLRHARLHRPGRRRLLAEDPRAQLDRRGGPERAAAGQQLVEHHPEGVEVGPVVHRAEPLAQLLGGHVGQRPGGRHVPQQVLLHDGDAEVGQVGPPLRVDQDVRRLDVPVDEPRLVGVAQGVGDLGHDPGDLPVVGAAGLDPRRQVGALDPLADDEAGRALAAHVVDGDDVRVPQPGHLAGLDAALVHLALGDRPVHPGHLHGDDPLQPGVEAPVHPPEAAHADQGVEPVAVADQSGAGRGPGSSPIRLAASGCPPRSGRRATRPRRASRPAAGSR